MSSALALTLLDKLHRAADWIRLHCTDPGLLCGPTALNLGWPCGVAPWGTQSTKTSRACRGGSVVTVPGMSWGVQGPKLSTPRALGWAGDFSSAGRAGQSLWAQARCHRGHLTVSAWLHAWPITLSHISSWGTVSSGLPVPVSRNSHSPGSRSSFLSPYIQRLFKNWQDLDCRKMTWSDLKEWQIASNRRWLKLYFKPNLSSYEVQNKMQLRMWMNQPLVQTSG